MKSDPPKPEKHTLGVPCKWEVYVAADLGAGKEDTVILRMILKYANGRKQKITFERFRAKEGMQGFCVGMIRAKLKADEVGLPKFNPALVPDELFPIRLTGRVAFDSWIKSCATPFRRKTFAGWLSHILTKIDERDCPLWSYGKEEHGELGVEMRRIWGVCEFTIFQQEREIIPSENPDFDEIPDLAAFADQLEAVGCRKYKWQKISAKILEPRHVPDKKGKNRNRDSGSKISTLAQPIAEPPFYSPLVCCSPLVQTPNGPTLNPEFENGRRASLSRIDATNDRQAAVENMRNAGDKFRNCADYQTAYTCYRNALALCHPRENRNLWLEIAQEAIWSLNTLGNTKQALEEAKLLIEVSAQRQLEFDDPEAHWPLYTYSWCHTRAGNYQEAIRIGREVLARRIKISGKASMITAHANVALGRMLRIAGRFSEAEALLREGLAARIRCFGENSAPAGCASDNLNWVFTDAGRPEAARPLVETSLNCCVHNQSERCLHHSSAYICYGEVLAHEGNWDGSFLLLKQGIQIEEKVLGPHLGFKDETDTALIRVCEKAIGSVDGRKFASSIIDIWQRPTHCIPESDIQSIARWASLKKALVPLKSTIEMKVL